jgi:hypothetical protein
LPGLPGSLSSSLSRSPVSCPRSGNGSSSARRGLPRAAIFTCLLGFVAIVLFGARRWGVHRGLPHGGRAGDLPGASIAAAGAWHVGLARGQRGAGPGYPHSLEWHRPARSANAVVGATILALRLWVAIGILAVLKRPWDEWDQADLIEPCHTQRVLLTWPGVGRPGLPRQSPALTPGRRRRRRRLESAALIIGGALA